MASINFLLEFRDVKYSSYFSIIYFLFSANFVIHVPILGLEIFI